MNFKLFEHTLEEKRRNAFEALKKIFATAAAAGFVSISGYALHEDQETLSPPAVTETKPEIIKPADRLTEKAEPDAEKVSYLRQKYPKQIMAWLDESELLGLDRARRNPGHPDVKGFSQLFLNNRALADTWNDNHYPQGFMDGNVAGIYYSGEAVEYRELGRGGGLKGDKKGRTLLLATAEGLKNDSIEIHRTHDPRMRDQDMEVLRTRLNSLDDDISHETGHLNDPFNANCLTISQRVDYLYELAKAYEEAASLIRDLPGDYTAEITHKNKRIAFLYKVQEYCAVLHQTYLSHPELFDAVATEKEKELINKWLLHDKPFDAQAMAELRRSKLSAQVAEAVRINEQQRNYAKKVSRKLEQE